MATKRSVKIVLSVIAAIIVTVFAIAGYGVWRTLSFLSEISSDSDKQVPIELAQPRVLTGSEFLSKRQLFKKTAKSFSEVVFDGSARDEEDRDKLVSIESAKKVYGFSDIRLCGDEIVAAGEFGAYIIDRDGNLKRFVAFERLKDEIKVLFWTQKTFRDTTDNLRIFDIESDGRCEYHSNGPSDGLALFDSEGRVLWRYRNRSYREYLGRDPKESNAWVTDVGTADLNDDGKTDLILSLNGEGIRAFTADQKEIWFRAGDISSDRFHLLDVDNDGNPELLNFIGGGSELMDRATGELIKEFPLEPGADGVMVVESPSGKKEFRLGSMSGDKFELHDLEGNTIFASDAPLKEVKAVAPKDYGSFTSDTENIYQPLVRAVSLKNDAEKFYVVLGSYVGIPRSQLYVYDSKGKLVYQEMLDEEAEAMTVLAEPEGREGFIVAGKHTVWRYSAK